MKKKVTAFMFGLGFLVSSISNGAMSLSISATQGVGDSTASGPIGVGALVYVVWSSDQTYETPLFGALPSAPNPTVTASAWGSDYVMNAYRITSSDGSLPDDGAYTYGDSLVGATIQNGYAYLVIFQTPAATDPVVGTWYARSAFFAVADTPDGQPQASTDMDIAAAVPFFVDQGQVVAVPEPSTVCLLFVGAGIVALRRMRRS